MNINHLSLLGAIALTPMSFVSARAQSVWINEFHYDNTGPDVGEFVEVIAPVDFTALATVRLTLYNGGDGTPYGSSHLLSTFTPGAEESGFRIYSKSISALQNGAPDGFSLDVGGDVRQFISYEGHFSATAGPAVGLGSQDVNFVESELTPIGSSVGMVGTGWDPSQFVWNTSASATPGQVNVGQGFSVVPEPSTYALFTAGALVGYAGVRRRRDARPGARA